MRYICFSFFAEKEQSKGLGIKLYKRSLTSIWKIRQIQKKKIVWVSPLDISVDSLLFTVKYFFFACKSMIIFLISSCCEWDACVATPFSLLFFKRVFCFVCLGMSVHVGYDYSYLIYVYKFLKIVNYQCMYLEGAFHYKDLSLLLLWKLRFQTRQKMSMVSVLGGMLFVFGYQKSSECCWLHQNRLASDSNQNQYFGGLEGGGERMRTSFVWLALSVRLSVSCVPWLHP